MIFYRSGGRRSCHYFSHSGRLSKFAPSNIVHFYAHLDYSHDYQRLLFSQGSPVRRCREPPHVSHITSMGIQTRQWLIITTN